MCGEVTGMKKKIIIFTSSGGGGHISVSNALEKTLQNEYNVAQVHIFRDVLGSFLNPSDILKVGRLTGEQMYNFVHRKKWTLLTNIMYKFAKIYLYLLNKKIKRTIDSYLKKTRPDVVVSVVPLINNHLIECCKKYNIPFVLAPTDLDAKSFLLGIKQPEYEKFTIATSFDIPEIIDQFASVGIKKENIKTTGFVLRNSFFNAKDVALIKKEYDIPEGKPVIFIMLSAVGLDDTYFFAQELAHLQTPLHVIVCAGKNNELLEKLCSIDFPENISTTFLGFTNKIADLIAIADIGIIKSGSVSFCEGLYSNLPLLIDGTATVLTWEKFNHHFLQEKKFGEIISTKKDFTQQVARLLANKQQLAEYRINLQKLPKKDGAQEIKKIIDVFFTQ